MWLRGCRLKSDWCPTHPPLTSDSRHLIKVHIKEDNPVRIDVTVPHTLSVDDGQLCAFIVETLIQIDRSRRNAGLPGISADDIGKSISITRACTPRINSKENLATDAAKVSVRDGGA